MIRRLLLASLGAFFVIGSSEPALAADPRSEERRVGKEC